MSDRLTHPMIRSAEQTCEACPDQWEGELRDGRAFYFRYRFGRATLAVGPDHRSVSGVCSPDQPGVRSVLIGHHLAGVFKDDQEREAVFGQLIELHG